MINFWNDLPRPFFILAPMEAVTDTVFRHVIASVAPPDVYFTEFTNATGWVNAGDKAIGGRLIKYDDEKPIVAQIWGSVPDDFAKLATHCKVLGFDGIDINTGCPESHAVKSGGGAALCQNPKLAKELIEAAKTAGLPVSVKCRLGYSKPDEFKEWISFLLSQNLAALTIHLRTKKEMSKVDAHWELMPEIVKMRDEIAPKTLIIGNGDVRDRKHGEELIKQTGCDGIMIARGVFHNPFCFEKIPREHSRAELIDLLKLQLHWFDKQDAILPRKFDPLKRFFKIYIRDFEGAAELRDKLMHTKNTDEVRQIINGGDA